MGLSAATQTLPSDRIRLFLCGDVMTGRGVDQILSHPSDPQLFEQWASSAQDYVRLAEGVNGVLPRGVETSYVWGEALEEWRRSGPHVRIANLETSVTRSARRVPKGVNYRMSPENVGCLTAAGFDCCVLANNHVLDWGRDGLAETLDTLRAHGLATAGAGRDIGEARRPAVLDIAGRGRVLVVGLGASDSGIPPDWAARVDRPGVNLIDLSPKAARELADQLATVRQPGDVVVASVHWGGNWGYDVPDEARGFAHALIEMAGVDLVHGHSSHHPKAMEAHAGRLILYGCGDFLNDYEGIAGYEQFRSELTIMYFADLDRRDGRLLALEMVPMRIRRFRLEWAAPEEAGWLEAVLDREATRFGGRVKRSGDRLVFFATAS